MSEQITIDAITKRIFDKADNELKEETRKKVSEVFYGVMIEYTDRIKFGKRIIDSCDLSSELINLLFESQKEKNRENAISRFMQAVDVVSSEL